MIAVTMLRLHRERDELAVVADQVGTPTAASSLAAALWATAGHPGLSGTFHWSDAGVCSWYDFAVAIGEEAVALAHSLRPDVLLMDLRMPKLDGMRATARITAAPAEEPVAEEPAWRSHLGSSALWKQVEVNRVTDGSLVDRVYKRQVP